MPTVVVQRWEESERGWGVRPDGYTLHKTKEDLQEFIATHWRSLPDETPDEYSRPSGAPYTGTVRQEVYDTIKGVGIWGTGHEPARLL